MPDDMGAEDRIGLLIDDHLRPGLGLGIGPRREPVLHVADGHLGLEALLLGLRLGEPDARQRRHGVDGGRKARIVGLVLRPLDDVAADDLPLIGGERRELRRPGENVAARIDGGIRGRAEVLVDGEPEPVMGDAAGVEIEMIDIGDTS